ncbi:non-homologous end-joining DNA ligase [Kineococcus gynurae]|uniref:DNA ligase (ATP) n=1 Tax=Kineococcus gynurae TaxID=452979 RepID=A0ABV5LS07_9ACTN
MLATAAPTGGIPRDGDRWAYEVKWDGMRVLADVRAGAVTLLSRTGRDVTGTFPEFARLGEVHADVLLDGEIVALAEGVPSFEALGERMHIRDARSAALAARALPVTLMAFDVLRLYGVDLVDRPWQERRDALDRLTPSGDAWLVSPVYPDAEVLLAATEEQGLEGVVAKRRGSRYQPGRRSPDWVKHAHRRTQSAAVVGWRPVEGSTTRMGALLLAVPDAAGVLRYAGRAGSGLTAGMEADLRRALRGSEVATPPLPGIPRVDAAGATFCEPGVVVDVRHLGRTTAGRLRQPTLRGLRADLGLADLREE